jgi:protein-S-isoprenylcysteine O-methyltransferase Ste14
MTTSKDRNLRDHSGVYLPPPLLYALVFVGGMLLQRVWPVPILPSAVGRAAGMVCILSGVMLEGWSILTFRRAGTSVIPFRPSTAIVTDGPFRFSRNPIYVALALLYLGATFWLNSLWPLLLFPVLLFLVQIYVIAREERYLERKFGGKYLQYKSRVRRWL